MLSSSPTDPRGPACPAPFLLHALGDVASDGDQAGCDSALVFCEDDKRQCNVEFLAVLAHGALKEVSSD
jgi:hypothetical protein